MLVASVAEAKKPSRGILQWLAPSLIAPAGGARRGVLSCLAREVSAFRVPLFTGWE
jgi:hypothetical protein